MTNRQQQIKALIATELRIPADSLRDDLTLESIGFDSLQAAEAILAIEQKLGCEIDAPQITAALTRDTRLGELVDMIVAVIPEEPRHAGTGAD